MNEEKRREILLPFSFFFNLYGEKMKTESDLMELITFICDYYNLYREILNLNHEEAKHKTELTYSDIYSWIYSDEIKEVKK